jgi:hypothetical protein
MAANRGLRIQTAVAKSRDSTLATKNVVESELILLGTDFDNEGKPIAYLGQRQRGSCSLPERHS